jgi:hypothetical protein
VQVGGREEGRRGKTLSPKLIEQKGLEVCLRCYSAWLASKCKVLSSKSNTTKKLCNKSGKVYTMLLMGLFMG